MHRFGIVCSLFVIVFIGFQPICARAEVQSSFRYTIADTTSETGHQFERFACVATAVNARWAITAAHCLRGSESHLFIQCWQDIGVATRHVSLLSLVQHPTHDVTLLAIDDDSVCTKGSMQLHSIDTSSRLFINTLPDPHITNSAETFQSTSQTLTLQSTDAHTVQVQDDIACLDRGDSGYPAMTKVNTTDVLVALLIAGGGGCPTNQTLIRLQPIAQWIIDTIRTR